MCIKRYYLYHRDRHTTDLISIQVYSRTGLAISSEVNISRVVAVFCYLNKYPNVFNEKVISTTFPKDLHNVLVLQAQSYCWLPVVSNLPEDYPTCLKWKDSLYGHNLASSKYNPLVVLHENIKSSQLPMIAGSQAILDCSYALIVNLKQSDWSDTNS